MGLIKLILFYFLPWLFYSYVVIKYAMKAKVYWCVQDALSVLDVNIGIYQLLAQKRRYYWYIFRGQNDTIMIQTKIEIVSNVFGGLKYLLSRILHSSWHI